MSSHRETVFIADRSSGRDNHFNLIRMIAASGVLVSHAFPVTLGVGAAEPLQNWLQGISLGSVCVFIFFAISGFFIAKSYDRQPDLGRFLQARALRLFPALLFVLVLTVCVAGLFLTTASGATYWAEASTYVLRNLLLFDLQFALPGVFEDNLYGPTINGSLWSLFHEVVCYFGVLLVGLLGLLHRRWVILGLLVGFIILQPLALALLPLPGKLATFLHLALPFAVGTAFYVWRAYIPLHFSVGLGLAALAAAAYFTPVFKLMFCLALCYWVFLLGLAKAPRLLAYNRLGDYSYGIYIYAFPFQQLLAFWGVTQPLVNIGLALLATLVMAVLSWHVVEKPALSWVRRPSLAQKE